MKIYILGCGGMLGHRLFVNFLKYNNFKKIRGSVRQVPEKLKNYKK